MRLPRCPDFFLCQVQRKTMQADLVLYVRILEQYEHFYRIAVGHDRPCYTANLITHEFPYPEWSEDIIAEKPAFQLRVQQIPPRGKKVQYKLQEVAGRIKPFKVRPRMVALLLSSEDEALLLQNMNSQAFVQVKYFLQYPPAGTATPASPPTIYQSNPSFAEQQEETERNKQVEELTKHIGQWHQRELEAVRDWNHVVVPDKWQLEWKLEDAQLRKLLQVKAKEELARRAMPPPRWWRLPGGDVERSDASQQDAVLRELKLSLIHI